MSTDEIDAVLAAPKYLHHEGEKTMPDDPNVWTSIGPVSPGAVELNRSKIRAIYAGAKEDLQEVISRYHELGNQHLSDKLSSIKGQMETVMQGVEGLSNLLVELLNKQGQDQQDKVSGMEPPGDNALAVAAKLAALYEHRDDLRLKIMELASSKAPKSDYLEDDLKQMIREIEILEWRLARHRIDG